MNAWLITWESANMNIPQSEKVAAILSSRKSSEQVRDLIEFLYCNATGSLSERAGFARNRRTWPYKAQWGTVGRVPINFEIYCGHNPHLFARKVRSLEVVESEDGTQQATWEEISKANVRRAIERDRDDIELS